MSQRIEGGPFSSIAFDGLPENWPLENRARYSIIEKYCTIEYNRNI